jgi:GTPase SAR1 family protein
MSLPRLTVAVVGHTNTGKTSLLRTLLRDTSFGDVSDHPATTRDVSATVLLVDGTPLVELYDTPGLEDSIGLLEHLESLRASQREDAVEIVERFLASPEAGARGDFVQEAKALRQLLRSDAGLYVVDSRDRPLPKHRDELAVLSMCARPIVPVLNFTADPTANTSAWREQLSRLGLHAVAEFDTVVVDEHSEERLFEKMQTLLDEFRPTLENLISDRRLQRVRLITASARLVADLLVDAAAATVTVPVDDEERMTRAMESFRSRIRQREQQCVDRLLELHRFHPDDCEPEALPLEEGQWGLDVFSPEAMKQFGVRAGSAAAAGAMAGLAVDVAVGGISLGAGTATGAALGAALSAGQSHGRRILSLLRGQTELRCDPTTLHLLTARQVDLVRALLARGHAAQHRLRIDGTGGDQPGSGRAPLMLPRPLAKARGRPAWSSLTSGDGSPATTDGSQLLRFSQRSREAAVDALADLITPRLKEPRGVRVYLGQG